MSTALRRAVYGKLAGDTTLNSLLATPPAGYSKSIYHDEAPADANYPFVVFHKQVPAIPTYAMTTTPAFETDVWLVKAIDRNTTADPAEAIAARLTVLLNDTTLSISGGTLLYLRRQSDVEYPETTDGVSYKHCGALFRLLYEAVV